MFAYCGNDEPNRVDPSGTRYFSHNLAEGGSVVSIKGDNYENIKQALGESRVASIPDNAMVVVENIRSISITNSIALVHGTAVVMDCEKYCMYSFEGLSFGVSCIPYDYCETVGYVYGVQNVEDYSGLFFGGSFNQIMNISGGAIAPNGVWSEVLNGMGFMSASAGGSITYYSTQQTDWKYGKANINWHASPYRLNPWDNNVQI